MNRLAVEVGPRFGCSRDLAGLAAWVHDVCRAERGDRLLTLARDFGLPVSPLEERAPVLLHGPVGAEVLRRDWGITHPDVLAAVRCHTTGRREMTLLDRVLVLCDKLDPNKDRAYPFNTHVRHLLKRDLSAALLSWFDGQMSAFLTANQPIHPLMTEARNALLLERMKPVAG